MAKGDDRVTKQELTSEVSRRRTFAIISHPDAGKTTLTEKLLLYGGAVQVAGAVKSSKNKKAATSDWMAIEKERGISVATSVMQFDYEGCRFNLLDTPGHNDFSEDTYRTLAAADCAVMLVDHAKGVEPQTIKLFQVCRMRGLPIVTFVNKLDRDGKEPLDVLADIEEVLDMPCSPLTWPVGMGHQFQGVYDRENKAFYKFERAEKQGRRASSSGPLSGPEALAETVGESAAQRLADEDLLLDEAGNPFEMEAFLKGETTPVFFGSAMNDFGVEPFLRRFMSLCPTPTPRKTDDGDVRPTDEEFSGFVFKIQANMDPKHRDRIAFLRVCSGRFDRGMQLLHPRTGRKITIDRSLQFLAQSRETVEVAYPGDILGLWDPGILRIGDALVEKNPKIFDGIPIFSPEHFVRPVLADPMKRKQMNKGLEQLSEEGAVQVFRDRDHSMVDPVLGAVGWLQIEVVQHRLKAEYNVDARFDRLPFKCARWVEGDKYEPEKLGYRDVRLVFDVADRPLLLFKDKWTLDRLQEKADHLKFIAAVQPARRESGR